MHDQGHIRSPRCTEKFGKIHCTTGRRIHARGNMKINYSSNLACLDENQMFKRYQNKVGLYPFQKDERYGKGESVLERIGIF